MQKTVTGLGSQMRVLVASIRRPADMAVLAAQALPPQSPANKPPTVSLACRSNVETIRSQREYKQSAEERMLACYALSSHTTCMTTRV